MSEIKFGICGDIDVQNTSDEDDPLVTLSEDKVGELIYEINRGGAYKEELSSSHPDLKEDIDKLVDLGFLREEDGSLTVNFTFIDEEDMEYIIDTTDRYASDLTERLMVKKEKIFSVLDRYENKNIDKQKLAFIIIGCYILDWSMLEFFRSRGIADHMKEQPGGNRYLLWGESEYEGSLKEIYWGGHSFHHGGYNFHTFGDHSEKTRRYALPDLIYGFRDLDFEGWGAMKGLLFEKRKDLLVDLGELMDLIGKDGISVEGINDQGSSKQIEFLKKIDYIGQRVEDGKEFLFLKIPYFDENDIGSMKEIVNELAPTLERWFDENLVEIEKDMQDIKPIKNGVPFDEVFIQIWHYIFGLTNKHLAERGIIYDTYSKRSDHKGYLPALIKGDVLDEIEEEVKR